MRAPKIEVGINIISPSSISTPPPVLHFPHSEIPEVKIIHPKDEFRTRLDNLQLSLENELDKFSERDKFWNEIKGTKFVKLGMFREGMYDILKLHGIIYAELDPSGYESVTLSGRNNRDIWIETIVNVLIYDSLDGYYDGFFNIFNSDVADIIVNCNDEDRNYAFFEEVITENIDVFDDMSMADLITKAGRKVIEVTENYIFTDFY